MEGHELQRDGRVGELRLRDGAPVWWRYTNPSDRAAFEAGFAKLSKQSRFLRFGQDVDELPDAWWKHLVEEVDQHSHISLVLYAGDTPIAVCHLIRSADDWHTADVAVTVADDWQGRGAGGLLLREALRVAGDVRRIDTQVLLANTAAVQLLESVGELQLECVQGHCRAIVDVARDRGAPIVSPVAAGTRPAAVR